MWPERAERLTGEVHRNPQEHAGTGAIRQTKNPNRERLGFHLTGTALQRANSPVALGLLLRHSAR